MRGQAQKKPTMKSITSFTNYADNDTEYLFCVKGRPFPCLVSQSLPSPSSTLIDFNLIHGLGLKMTNLMCQKFSFAGHKLRILGRISTNVQCVIDGVAMGRFNLKATVVKDLEKNLDTECVASANMAAQLQGNDDNCTSSGALSPAASSATSTPSRSRTAAAATPQSTPSQPSPRPSSRTSPSPRRSPPGFPDKPQHLNYMTMTSPTNYRAQNVQLLSQRFADADLLSRRNLSHEVNAMNQLQHLKNIDPHGRVDHSGTTYDYILTNGLHYQVGHGRNGCRYDKCGPDDLPPDNCGFQGLTFKKPFSFEPCGDMCQGGLCQCLSNYLSN